MNYEERIIDTILNTIKDNQIYLTQKENPPKYGKDNNKYQKDQCDNQIKFAENFIKKFGNGV